MRAPAVCVAIEAPHPVKRLLDRLVQRRVWFSAGHPVCRNRLAAKLVHLVCAIRT
jgi:hypothetical protein